MRGAQFRKNISVLLFPILIPVLILVGLMTISFLPDTMFNRILTMTNMQDTSTRATG